MGWRSIFLLAVKNTIHSGGHGNRTALLVSLALAVLSRIFLALVFGMKELFGQYPSIVSVLCAFGVVYLFVFIRSLAKAPSELWKKREKEHEERVKSLLQEKSALEAALKSKNEVVIPAVAVLSDKISNIPQRLKELADVSRLDAMKSENQKLQAQLERLKKINAELEARADRAENELAAERRWR